jgi:hypothetical protein
MMMAKSLMTIKCPLSAGCSDCHGGLPVQYKAHLPMEHLQGYAGSHWMLPLDDYSLCIALAAYRAAANKTTMKKWANLLAILMAAAVRRYNTACIAQWRRSRALVEATGRRPRASIAANSCIWSHMRRYFLVFSSSKP